MQRVNVVGTSGSGKSTFSRRLADKLGAPYIEMDALFWKPNWQESSDEELFRKISDATSQPRWVLDGNYNRTVHTKWREVDTVVWLDYSFARTLYQAVKRAISRAATQKELWAGTGNRESFKQSFFSRDSIILWTIKTHGSNRERYTSMMADPRFSHIEFVHLTSPKQAKSYLNTV